MDPFLHNPFMLMALIASVLASVIGGTVGAYVVAKRISFLAGSISHAMFGGLGLAFYLKYAYQLQWLSPSIATLFSTIFFALLIGMIHHYSSEHEDSIIASIWTMGMAVGALFVSLTPGLSNEFSTLLFGNILWVAPEDLVLLGLLSLITVAMIYICYRQFFAIVVDEELAIMQGIAVKIYYFLLLGLLAAAILVLSQVVGTTLVITLLTLPGAIALRVTRHLHHAMGAAVILNLFFCSGGLLLSYHLDWPAGATIGLLSSLTYLLTLLHKR
jgi:zinc transport system permease protein